MHRASAGKAGTFRAHASPIRAIPIRERNAAPRNSVPDWSARGGGITPWLAARTVSP